MAVLKKMKSILTHFLVLIFFINTQIGSQDLKILPIDLSSLKWYVKKGFSTNDITTINSEQYSELNKFPIILNSLFKRLKTLLTIS